MSGETWEYVAGRHHHYLTALRLDRLVPSRERGGAFLDHEDLLVRVPVQHRAAPRWGVHHDERDARAEVVALELVRIVAARGVGEIDDARCVLLSCPPVL